MIQISIKSSELEKIHRAIKAKVAEVTSDFSAKVYGEIVGGVSGTGHPYWSGSYISSWNMNVGTPDRTFNPAPKYKGGAPTIRYGKPRQFSPIIDKNNPYTTVWITNSVPHAYQVEYVGTPRHPSPWMIAHYAVNLARYV